MKLKSKEFLKDALAWVGLTVIIWVLLHMALKAI